MWMSMSDLGVYYNTGKFIKSHPVLDLSPSFAAYHLCSPMWFDHVVELEGPHL